MYGQETVPSAQRPPRANSFPHVHDLVIADIKGRQIKGIETYGMPLQPFNGRDALQDAYEEALDLACYLKQKLIEDHGR